MIRAIEIPPPDRFRQKFKSLCTDIYGKILDYPNQFLAIVRRLKSPAGSVKHSAMNARRPASIFPAAWFSIWVAVWALFRKNWRAVALVRSLSSPARLGGSLQPSGYRQSEAAGQSGQSENICPFRTIRLMSS